MNATISLGRWGSHPIARTDTLRDCPAEVLAVAGPIETMTRGAREWLITIPADGALPLGGAMPMLIEWLSARKA